MTHTINKLPKSEAEFTITVPWSEWEGDYKSALVSAAQNVEIPGFRKGKAPEHMVVEKVGNGAILEDAAEKAVRKNYVDAVKKENLRTVGDPSVELKKISQGGELEFFVKTALIPEVVIGEWRKKVAAVNKERAEDTIEITDDQVSKELESVAKSRAALVTVLREAKEGDSVTIDFDVIANGAKMPGGEGRDHSIVLGSKTFIPGFEEQLLGTKEGDTRSFTLTFPQEYHEKKLAGKDAQFDVTVKLVQEQQIPEINDEFVKGLGKFETLDDLKKNIREGLEAEENGKKEREHRDSITQALIEATILEIPEVMIRSEIERLTKQMEIQLSQIGGSLDSYLEMTNKTLNDMQDEWREQAEKNVKTGLILAQLSDDNEITVETSEVEEEMNKQFAHLRDEKEVRENTDLEQLYSQVRAYLLEKKIFEWLTKV